MRYFARDTHFNAAQLQFFHASPTPAAAAARRHVNDAFARSSEVGGGLACALPLHHFAAIAGGGGASGRFVCVVRALVAAGADADARVGGDTALLAAARAPHRPEMVEALVEAGADVAATSTAERGSRFGRVPLRQSALGLVLAQEAAYRAVRAALRADPAMRDARRRCVACLRRRGARVTDGDFFALWVDRARRCERYVLDAPYGAALAAGNAWTFPPRVGRRRFSRCARRATERARARRSFFRCARLLAADVRLRDGTFGRGLGHEPALLRNVFAFLGRADVVGFFPDRLDSVIYGAKENRRWRDRGRR